MGFSRAAIHCVLTAACLAPFSCVLPAYPQAASNGIPFDQAYRPSRWDSSHEVLFVGRGVLRVNNSPIKAYKDGAQVGADINIFKDFFRLETAAVDDIAAGPGGTTIVAAVLGYGGKNIRHTILTYDASGNLKAVWDTSPYIVEAITVDDGGNVFALADRVAGSAGTNYPLLTVYNSDGHVLYQGLDSSVLKQGSSAMEGAHGFFDPSIQMVNDRLYIYFPTENAALICSKEGNIFRRLELDPVFAKLSEDRGHSDIYLNNGVIESAGAVLDITGYAQNGQNAHDLSPKESAIISVGFGSQDDYHVLRSASVRNWMVLGISGGQLVTTALGEGGVILTRSDLPAEQ